LPQIIFIGFKLTFEVGFGKLRDGYEETVISVDYATEVTASSLLKEIFRNKASARDYSRLVFRISITS